MHIYYNIIHIVTYCLNVVIFVYLFFLQMRTSKDWMGWLAMHISFTKHFWMYAHSCCWGYYVCVFHVLHVMCVRLDCSFMNLWRELLSFLSSGFITKRTLQMKDCLWAINN